MISSHRRCEPGPVREREVGLSRARFRRRVAASSAAAAAWGIRLRSDVPPERPTGRRRGTRNGAAAIPIATKSCPDATPTTASRRETSRASRPSKKTRPAVQGKHLMPGKEAAGEVGRRVREHRDDEDPSRASRTRPRRSSCRRAAQEQRNDHEQRRQRQLDRPPPTFNGALPVSPRASRSAMVRERSCSTGR